MKSIGVLLLAVLVSLMLVSTASAAVSQATIDAIIADAQDGTLDGQWTNAQVQAALDWLLGSSVAQQYTDVQDVLEDYLAGTGDPGSGTGNLSFTGANLTLAFGIGIGLIGTGLLLRRALAR